MTENEILKVMPGWEIVRIIGTGGFGKVYEIRKNDGFGDVGNSALKVISIPESHDETATYRDDGLDDESITALFKDRAENLADEFKLMSKLKGNSNIVSYEDHYIIPNPDQLGWDILIRMELLTSLPDYYRDKYSDRPVDEMDAVKLGIDICRALELCAKYKIIHRDIKPQNIFINANGDYKLGDFGVARTLDHATQATKAGTAKYMAPEVNKGMSYDASVDMYSLGLVIYWMLNERRLPFLPLPPLVANHRQEEEAIAKRMAGEVLPKAAHAGEAMHAVIQRACACEAAKRFNNPTEMRLELEKILALPVPPELEPGPVPPHGVDGGDGSGPESGPAPEVEDDVGETEVKYCVRFLDEDGKLLDIKYYDPHERVVLPPVPVREDDEEYHYQFLNWVPQVESTARHNASYTASYVREKILPPPVPPKKNLIKIVAPIAGGVVLVAVLLVLLLGGGKDKNVDKGPANDSVGAVTATPVPEETPAVEEPADEPEASPEPTPEPVWSDWVEQLPSDVSLYNSEILTKTQYRSAVLHTLYGPTDGYTKHSTVVGNWGAWSAWQSTPINASGTVDVETSTTYYYKTGSYQMIGNEFHTATRKEWVVSDWIKSSGPVFVGGNIVDVKTSTQYRSRTRQYTTYYTKDDSWSEYTDNVLYPNSNTAVETRVVYKYLNGSGSLTGSMTNFTFSNADYSTVFSDVPAEKWYGGSDSCMGTAVELGIFGADTQNRVFPEDGASIGDVVKAAAIIHQTYCGVARISGDGNDYTPYIEYAVNNCLIGSTDFADYTVSATRQEAAYILRNVLPGTEMEVNNNVGSIKDMYEDSRYYEAVLRMIGSGIVAWPEADYDFNPEGSVSRAELAAFVDRIVKPEQRSSNK